MKKVFFIALCACIPLLLFCGCQTVQTEPAPAADRTVTFVNSVADADVWILPETEQNLKTTVWGTATAADVKTGESRQVPLTTPGGDGFYMFRMIDTEHFYYSANDITLEEGWTLEIRGNDLSSITLEISDGNGTLLQICEVFAARL